LVKERRMAKRLDEKDIKYILGEASQTMLNLLMLQSSTVKAAITLWNSANTDIRSRDRTSHTDEIQVIAEQADAAVDLRYYCLNALAKIGVNVDTFDISFGLSASHSTKQSTRVIQFTQESGVQPKQDVCMNIQETEFLVRMMCSELIELIQTGIHVNVDSALGLLRETIASTQEDGIDEYRWCLDATRSEDSPQLILKYQVQELERLWYVIYTLYQQHGIDLDKVFDVVHEANMAKRFPDGKFHKREDGKIIKPPGWKEPDIVSVIRAMM
jgi:predicted HAD superfamily Cof-like phosphohydrolase